MAEPEDTKRPGSDRPMRRPQSGYRPGGEIVGRSNTGRPTSEDAARFGLDKTKPASADSLRSAEAGARDDTRTIHNNPIREAEHAAITPNLREAEETGADESDGGLYNAGGDDSVSTEAQSSRGPRSKRRSRKGSGSDNDSLYNPEDEGGRLQNARARLSRLSKSWWFRGSAGAVAIGILVVVLILLILSSLKLPNVMQHIAGYEFARVTRQFNSSAQNVTDEALAVEGANDGVAAALKDKYQGLRDNTWGKLDQYRPNKVIENLGESNDLELRFSTSKLTGREIFTGGSINGIDFEVEPVTGIAKWTPGINQIVKFKNRMSFNQSGFFQAVSEEMQSNNINPLVRGLAFKTLLKDTGGSLSGYVLSKFSSTDSAANEAEATKETFDATEAGPSTADNAATQQISEADQAAADATKQDVQDPKKVEQIVQNGGIDQNAQSAADSALGSSFATTALDIANPVYAFAAPACIVYDGSVQHSKPSIDNQTRQQQNAYNNLAARADEQKSGGPPDGSANSGELATAIGATNNQLGDITGSNPEIRAAGGTPNTSDIPSAEAGAGGSFDYSIFDALGIPQGSPEGTALNWAFGNACPTLTNIYAASGLALLNIIAAIVSLGSSQAAEEAAGQSASEFISQYVKTVASNAVEALTSKVIVKNGVKTVERGFLNRALRFTFKQGLIVGATVGATDLAHLIVAARSGIANNGLAQGGDLVNEADSGANIRAGELDRHMLFGRPLLKDEVAASDQQDQNTIAYQNQQRSFTDRYFATSNADSLVSHIGISLSSSLRGGIATSLARLGASIFRPTSLLATATASFDSSAVAAPDPSTQHYGNVQFGWSQDEENLINSDGSYKMLENQKILDDSGKEAAIAQKYAICFGYDADSQGNLTDALSGDGSLGSLLANGDINRDSNGNVINGPGVCSPDNLTYTNKEFGPQMVFRWRLAQRYLNTVDQLTQEQTLTVSDPTAGGSGPPTSGPTAPGASGYKDPFSDATGMIGSRVDQGVDFDGSGPVHFLGNAHVTYICSSGCWEGESFITYQLLDGPAQNKYVFVAEGCNPASGLQVSATKVYTSSDVVCNMYNGPHGIETGWAAGATGDVAAASGVYVELSSGQSYATAYGQNFEELLLSLGGNTPKACYDFPGVKLSGTLPSGWPTWTSSPATKAGSNHC